MKVVIVGNGVWGNALYSVVSQTTNDVHIATRGEKIVADIVIFAIPTSSIRDVLPLISFIDTKIIVNSSKGIEKDTHQLPHDIIQKHYGDTVDYFSLMGPSFAEEVTQKMPTLVNLGFLRESERTPLVQTLFETGYFKTRVIRGVHALELAGALKNIYAIACGTAEGLGYKTNTKTQLITLAIEEMHALYTALDIHVDTNITPELIGDLILTCTSGSRNFNFGRLLVSHTVEKAIEQIGSTVEGRNTVASIGYLEEKAKTSLPVAQFVSSVIATNAPSKVLTLFNNLLKRV